MSTKAQAFYMDFAIALLLFTITLVVYFGYTNNFQKQGKGDLDVLLSDAKSISSSLILSGYPEGWDNATVIRIGIADDQAVNTTKLNYFRQLNYTRAKKIFGTNLDYFVFFADKNDNVLNVMGICGVGSPMAATTFNTKTAYYYKDDASSLLKNFMNITLGADIYNGQISQLSSNLSKYKLVMMENPQLSNVEFNNYKNSIENFSSTGGILMISGNLANPSPNNMAGSDFNTRSGQSQSQRTAIVNSTDKYIAMSAGDIITFKSYNLAANTTAKNFRALATFNQTDEKAVAAWNYGNGTVYFFSDIDASYFSGNFTKLVQSASASLVGGTCTPINVSAIALQNLVKNERYLSYNSKLVKMVVYIWQ